MKKRVLLTPIEFKKKLDAYVDKSVESLKKRLKQTKKQKEKTYV